MSSRKHIAGAGQSSIQMGWGVEEKVASHEEIVLVEDEVEPLTPTEITDFRVGLMIVDGPGSEIIAEVVSKALAKVGIVNVFAESVGSPTMVPFVTQRLLDSMDGVIPLDIIVHDEIGVGQGSLSTVMSTACAKVSQKANKPIVSGFVCQNSLLEAKGVLPNLADEWASALLAALIESREEAIIVEDLNVSDQVPVRTVLPEEAEAPALLRVLKDTLHEGGVFGVFGLQRTFRRIDTNENGLLDAKEFHAAMTTIVPDMTKEQIDVLFDWFDIDKDGSISFPEFIGALMGVLNDRRKQLVMSAFEIMDTDKNGTIEVDDLRGKYDTSQHPDVISGRRSSDDILREFMDTFECGDRDGKITFDEFCRYYSTMSAAIEDDDYFELMMRNAWHISGGEGWCVNSSCRRVVVIHEDGHQSVEEIKDDLGIGPDDLEAMIANLAAQGITDVKSINKFGGIDSTEEPSGDKKPSGAPQNHAAGTKVRAYNDAGASKKRVEGGRSSVDLRDSAEAAPTGNTSKKMSSGSKSSMDLSESAPAGPAQNALRKKVEGRGGSTSLNLTTDSSGDMPAPTTTSKKMSATSGPSKVNLSHEGASVDPVHHSKKHMEGRKSTIDIANTPNPEGAPATTPSAKKRATPGASSGSSIVLG